MDQSSRQLPLKSKLGKLDLLRIVLLLIAVCCLFAALEEAGPVVPWGSAQIIDLFIDTGLVCLAFSMLHWELDEDATTSLRFLRQRTVLSGLLFLFCDGMSNYLVSAFGKCS